MNRKRKPKLPEGIEMPTVEPRIDPDLVTQTRRYKLITPLYGGGVTPGEADPITIVRASEVRGHLRFWWRATRGGQFDGDLEKMRKAEEAIWGSAAGKDKPGPSEVTIVIRVLDRGQPFQATNRKGDSIDNIGHPSSKFGYVAFPLRDSKHPVVLQDVEFELTLTYRKTLKLPFDKIEVKKEVNAAFWAWESFGGLGARTRRGFGAVQLEAIDNATVSQLLSADTEDAINRFLKEHVVDGNWPQDVPHLSHAMHRCVFTYDAGTNALAVWLDLTTALAEFRQAPKGRPPGTQSSSWRPGRSFWPEPDEIRRRTRAKESHPPRHPVRKFPRAAFGLPIIFEFKREDVAAGDPWKTTLQGLDHDRLASPLIIRPIACTDGAVGLAAILEAPIQPPGGWLLKDVPNSLTHPPIEAELANTAEANTINPLQNVGGETDVLLAFLKSLSN